MSGGGGEGSAFEEEEKNVEGRSAVNDNLVPLVGNKTIISLSITCTPADQSPDSCPPGLPAEKRQVSTRKDLSPPTQDLAPFLISVLIGCLGLGFRFGTLIRLVSPGGKLR